MQRHNLCCGTLLLPLSETGLARLPNKVNNCHGRQAHVAEAEPNPGSNAMHPTGNASREARTVRQRRTKGLQQARPVEVQADCHPSASSDRIRPRTGPPPTHLFCTGLSADPPGCAA